MEAQMQRPTHGQDEEADPHAGLHSVGEGEGGNEKKSVMKMVKNKAKKIKETIKKHGHGHDNEPEHGHDEDEEDTEISVDDPEIHGAPMYDSNVIPSTNLPKQVDTKPTDPRENRYDPKIKDETYPKVRHEGISGPVGLVETHEPEMKDTMPHNTRLAKPDISYPKSHINPNEGLEEDPHSSKTRPEQVPISNYESKVNDPTGQGGGEARVDPLISQFQDLDVRGPELESKPKPEQGSYAGSHDQFAPQPTPTKDDLTNSPKRIDTANPDQTMPRDTEAGKISAATSAIDSTNSPKRIDTANPDQTMPRDTVAGKISAATSAITERAVSAKNVVASKLGYGGAQSQPETVPEAPKKPVTQPETVPDAPKKPVTETYAHMIAEKLTPVYEKVAGAGTAVVSTVTGSGGSEERVGEKGCDKGVSVKEYWTEKLRPGDEDRALSDTITEALHKKKAAGAEKPVMGKVTESDEVRDRLGTGKENQREGEDALAAGSEGAGSGQGMVGKVKGAVSSWLGKSAGVQTAQDAVSQSYVSGTGSGHNTEVEQRGEDAVHGSNR